MRFPDLSDLSPFHQRILAHGVRGGQTPNPNPPGAGPTSPYIGVGPSRAGKGRMAGSAFYDLPVPQDGREYRWRNGYLEVKVNGKWRVQKGKNKGAPLRARELYKEGDEQDVAKLSHDQRAALQGKLDQAGLLSSYRVGIADAETLEAYRQLLGIANVNGKTANSMLDELVSNAESGGQVGMEGEGEERGPLQVELSNPSDLAAELRAVSGGPDHEGFGAIGRESTNEEAMRFAGGVHNRERMEQTDAYNRGFGLVKGQAGEFTETTSPDVAADDFLKQENPEEYLATRGAKAAAVWYDLLANSKWRLSSG